MNIFSFSGWNLSFDNVFEPFAWAAFTTLCSVCVCVCVHLRKFLFAHVVLTCQEGKNLASTFELLKPDMWQNFS